MEFGLSSLPQFGRGRAIARLELSQHSSVNRVPCSVGVFHIIKNCLIISAIDIYSAKIDALDRIQLTGANIIN
jgi:hypothetical protein